jgi:para-aminobenzoate synthetase component 1
MAPAAAEITSSTAPRVEEVTGLDPWEAAQRLAHLPHALFLDSAQAGGPRGRYSFVTADPFAWITAHGDMIFDTGWPRRANPFHVLANRLAMFRTEPIAGLPPFQGGAAGLLGYGLCHHIEDLPRPELDDLQTPDLAVGLYDWVLGFDHLHDRAWLISTGLPDRNESRAQERLETVLRLLDGPFVALSLRERNAPSSRGARGLQRATIQTPTYPVPGLEPLASNFRRDDYLDTVRRAIEYVHAGDCFQVNVAQRLLAPATLDPLELYGRLRTRNAAPFAGYFDLGEFVIASASPERFLRVERGHVETRPIKGTRPRGNTEHEDAVRADELRQSAKDRAENVMIVDLLRNDLGRVCQYGSVRVEALCQLESFRYVHHLVSEVRGRLRPECGLVDLLKATFPGGSVTGAPKVRAMQIITELERVARGPYCGCLGYLGFDGSMDTNLLIRTFTHGKGWLSFAVGGGIVADSQPEREYEETWHKAEGLLRALGN